MWNRLSLVAAPSTAPVTTARVKAHCQVDYSDHDTLFDELIEAARRRFDGPDGLGIALLTQTWRLSLDSFPATQIEIPMWPVKSIAAVTYIDANGDEQTWDSANYRLDKNRDPAILEPVYGQYWPGTRQQSGAVNIEFVVGEAANDINADLVRALIQLVAHWYENREAAMNQLHELPFGVRETMEAYRRGIVGA